MIYRIRHLTRSGGHAIAFWVAEHFETWAVFNNMRKHKPANIEKTPTTKVDTVVYTYENYAISRQMPVDLRYTFCDHIIMERTIDITILRDPLNWAASHLHSNLLAGAPEDRNIDLDKYIDYHQNYNLNYNKWFSESSYRKEMEKKFELPEIGLINQKVRQYGGGSSFDKQAYDGKASEMQVLNRWQKYRNYKQIQQILNNARFQKICKEDFNMEL